MSGMPSLPESPWRGEIRYAFVGGAQQPLGVQLFNVRVGPCLFIARVDDDSGVTPPGCSQSLQIRPLEWTRRLFCLQS